MTKPTPSDAEEPAWLHPHSHQPNQAPPAASPILVLTRPDDSLATITVADLNALPQQSVDNCYIVSTGHGSSGPFRFEGVALGNLFKAYGVPTWGYADVVSADGFGTRIYADEVNNTNTPTMLLALACDGKPLTLKQGLVRLIVPQEKDDALRQIKWVASIEVHAG